MALSCVVDNVVGDVMAVVASDDESVGTFISMDGSAFTTVALAHKPRLKQSDAPMLAPTMRIRD